MKKIKRKNFKSVRLVRPYRRNWDTDYYSDIMYKRGFIISEPAKISLDGSEQKSMFGADSPLYGTSYEDDQAFIERCRCECGRFKGRMFEGEICPYCEKEVKQVDSDINVTGWITLGNNYIINPYYYKLLQKAIGKDVFSDIVSAKYKIDRDGKRELAKSEDFDTEPSSPYAGIGTDSFLTQFDEIMEYFKSIKKSKAASIDRIIKEKRNIFTSHVPIYSTMLRPQSATTDTYYYGSYDKLVNTLFSLSESIKNCLDVERDYILYRLQGKVNAMWEINFDSMNGKEGFVRDQILGGSLNYTSRNVIVPDPTLRDNEVSLSYNTFLELFKYKIIYYIMKLNGITLANALSIWENASSKFDETVYDIMNYILKNDNPRLLINRNPTLNYYSMLLMKIRDIKRDIDDYNLSVPLSILPGLNADFDGDILNIIGLMDESINYMFRKFDPVIRMIISRDTGLLNNYFMITKAQLIDLHYFATIGASENDTPESPSENKEEVV